MYHLLSRAAAIVALAIAFALASCDSQEGPQEVIVEITGTVTQQSTGEPLEGVFVHLINFHPLEPTARIDTTETDVNGAYEVRASVPDCALLRLSATQRLGGTSTGTITGFEFVILDCIAGNQVVDFEMSPL